MALAGFGFFAVFLLALGTSLFKPGMTMGC
jgi:hypothetical protein